MTQSQLPHQSHPHKSEWAKLMANEDISVQERFVDSHSHKSEWAKLMASFTYAFSGLWYALRTQRNMRIHMIVAMIVIVVSTILHISPVEFALIFIAITGVFIAEMFNTVLEVCVDLASPHYHPLAKIAKDVAAGAVLANALLSIIIGLFVLGPHLLKFF